MAGIVVAGTTGESPTLSTEEHTGIVREAVRITGERISVIAGTGSNCTDEAIELTQAAERDGADGSLQVSPYYNKPSQEGLFQHFRKIADATELPIMLYDIPSRCAVAIMDETVARLQKACPNIVALKDASGRPERTETLHSWLGKDFRVFSGDDNLTVQFIAHGAVGVVSVLSNLLLSLMQSLVRAARREVKSPESVQLFLNRNSDWREVSDFIPLLFGAHGNPSGIKCAMERVQLDSGVLRLPLVSAPDPARTEIRRWLWPLTGFKHVHGVKRS
ncbi:MAG: dihydrodipicolinate synthase [Parcubacteria group bacterium Greene0416_79]|nr:MAG: dihydrodipicolinate synthase [Parcubacteria group bacterium Greene0416_79]